MKIKYISITIVLTLLVLFVINYFIGFLYYIPHQRMIIYEWKSNDIFARATPGFMFLEKEPLPLEINTCYPIYGKDYKNHEWSVIMEFEYINLPPEDFPLEWRYIEDMNRLIIDIPDSNVTYEK